MNGVYDDGCECQQDAIDLAGVGNTSANPYYLGTLSNDPGDLVSITGNGVPDDDADWYKFRIDDVCSTDTSCTTGITAIDIWLKQNPGVNYRMDIYAGGPPVIGDQTAYGEDQWAEWTCPDIMGHNLKCDEEFYIKVYQKFGEAYCGPYELQISVGDQVPQK